MLSFLASPPPRSRTAHLNPLVTGKGTTVSTMEFLPLLKSKNSPASTIAMRQFISPDPKNILDNPAYHWHATQTETFTVEQGAMKATLEGSEKVIPAGEAISIEKGQYHTYVNASTKDPLQVVISVDVVPGEDNADEAFFRNIYSYLDDCEKHKKGPSPFQMLLFLRSGGTYLVLPVIQRGLSRMASFFGGVIVGEWLLGFKKSYPEYMNGVELDELEEMKDK